MTNFFANAFLFWRNKENLYQTANCQSRMYALTTVRMSDGS